MRKAPQDMPSSRNLLVATGMVYVLLGTLLGSIGQSFFVGLMYVALDLVLMIIFVKLALEVTKHQARFSQTMTAMLGSGVVITGLAIPLVLAMSMEKFGQMPSLLWLSLIIWSLFITGHILRHALSIALPFGVALAVLYIITMSVLVQSLSPIVPAAS